MEIMAQLYLFAKGRQTTAIPKWQMSGLWTKVWPLGIPSLWRRMHTWTMRRGRMLPRLLWTDISKFPLSGTILIGILLSSLTDSSRTRHALRRIKSALKRIFVLSRRTLINPIKIRATARKLHRMKRGRRIIPSRQREGRSSLAKKCLPESVVLYHCWNPCN